MTQAVQSLAKALKIACEEHGIPNSFSPGEINQEYGGPLPTLIGRIMKDEDCVLALRRELEAIEAPSKYATYDGRVRFE